MESSHSSDQETVSATQDEFSTQISVTDFDEEAGIGNKDDYIQTEDADALEANNENQNKYELCSGMEFSSDESAYNAYRKYRGNHGFDEPKVRKAYSRPTTRCGCKARMSCYLQTHVEMLQHALDVYTPEVFTLFQMEYIPIGDYVAKRVNKSEMVSAEYNVSFRGVGRNHLVSYVAANKTIHCSCMKFSFGGILCRHALKVLAKKDVRRIPPTYILNRWSKEAKARTISFYHSATPNDTVKQSIGKRYSHICPPIEMLQHALDVYTPEVFTLFQKEYIPIGRSHLVNYVAANEAIHCSCMKFSFGGILCRHALEVLAKKDVRRIPPTYILNRWNKAASQLLEKLVEKKKELVKGNKWMVHSSDFELVEEEDEEELHVAATSLTLGNETSFSQLLQGFDKSCGGSPFQDSSLPLDTQLPVAATSLTLGNETSFSQLLQGFDKSCGGSP
ncbi:hypothetical protein F2Q68_00006206 [Brassica cretica]|uniref:Protein FAR1-RELATED SEQUENCE n=1 Tax=Brassica cretica TaxID=69181 RepID=A0A8S9JFZ3_BRACR|nr:hypothetical protein F2Q68_00006206 [Brassica cretica]